MPFEKITKTDVSNRTYFEFVGGTPKEWMQPYMKPPLLQVRISTQGKDWPNLKAGAVVIDTDTMGVIKDAYQRAAFRKV